MNTEQIKNEVKRLIDAGYPSVWVKSHNGDWEKNEKLFISYWESYDCIIVDDIHAELRKLQYDKPDTKFQVKNKNLEKWNDISIIYWNIGAEYRVKPKEWYEDPDMVGKPVWVRDSKGIDWELNIFKAYEKDEYRKFVTNLGYWRFTKPVINDDLYKGKQND